MDVVLPIAGGVALVFAIGLAVVTARRTVTWRRMVSEAERERDVANTLKNDFVAMVSHELRTPLTSIAGFSKTLEQDWENLDRGEVGEFLTIITTEAKYLGELVEDILVIPRLEAGRLSLFPEILDLSALIHEVSTTIATQSPEFEAAISVPGGVRVWADPRRVQQILRNLLENARKYGGDQVLVEGFPYHDHFVVVISDNGPGVADDNVNRIFEHFEQVSKGDARSSSGIGLGLPIARRLARAMGGDVWYERRFPTGSRFCLSLTVTPEAHERIMEEREASEAENSERSLSKRT